MKAKPSTVRIDVSFVVIFFGSTELSTNEQYEYQTVSPEAE